jgi:hypothetical protein
MVLTVILSLNVFSCSQTNDSATNGEQLPNITQYGKVNQTPDRGYSADLIQRLNEISKLDFNIRKNRQIVLLSNQVRFSVTPQNTKSLLSVSEAICKIKNDDPQILTKYLDKIYTELPPYLSSWFIISSGIYYCPEILPFALNRYPLDVRIYPSLPQLPFNAEDI